MSSVERIIGMASIDAIQTLFVVEEPAKTTLVNHILKLKLPRDREEFSLSFAPKDSKAANPTTAVLIRYKFSCRLRVVLAGYIRHELWVDSFEVQRQDGTTYCGDGRYRPPSVVA